MPLSRQMGVKPWGFLDDVLLSVCLQDRAKDMCRRRNRHCFSDRVLVDTSPVSFSSFFYNTHREVGVSTLPKV